MDDRHLTFIIVPHGELETRTFQISYRRLRLVLGIGVVLVLVVCVFLALWFPALTQAARVPGLERELAELEKERARVAELAQTLAAVEEQYEHVRQMLGADASVSGEAPVLPPLRSVTSRPADSDSAVDQIRSILTVWPVSASTPGGRPDPAHDQPALDLPVPANTEVRAAGPGTVAAAAEDPALGRYVVVDHGAGLQTVYAHAARLYVKVGEPVRAGQVIALSGATGRSTAPHLHFEIRASGRAVDPRRYLRPAR